MNAPAMPQRSTLCRYSATALITFALFFCIYYTNGLFLLNKTNIFEIYNIFFHFDVPRVVEDMTCASCRHYRTTVHPLFVLITHPLSLALTPFWEAPLERAVLMNAVVGACNVAASLVLFGLIRQSLLQALLFAVAFGFTANHFIIGAVPETGMWAVLSLLPTYFAVALTIRKYPLPPWVWYGAGFAAATINSINLLQAWILYTLFSRGPKSNKLKRFIFYPCIVGTSLMVMSLVQYMLYDSKLFIDLWGYEKDIEYLTTFAFERPFFVIAQIIIQFLLSSIIAPLPEFFTMPVTVFNQSEKIGALSFTLSKGFTTSGWVAAFLWLGMLLWSFKNLAQQTRPVQNLSQGLLMTLLIAVALHLFYGPDPVTGRVEIYLYTLHITLLLWVFIAYCLPKRLLWVLVFFVFFAGYNNHMTFEVIKQHYAQLHQKDVK